MSSLKKQQHSPVRTSVAGLTLLCASTAFAAAPVVVTNNNDSGAGSLRDALASGANVIQIGYGVTDITIDSTLSYVSTEPLRLLGWGQKIMAAGDFTLFEVSNGADVEIQNLAFEGIGGFSLDNPGTGKGIYVKVPETATGIVRVKLNAVDVMEVANHGIHISDCTLGDDCGSGSGGGGDGSSASVSLEMLNSMVWGAGHGKFDADGVRVDERADGDIMFKSTTSFFIGAGADGVELDEGNHGDVFIYGRSNFFEDNGDYCANAPLDLAQPCVEDDDGEMVLDLDDAFDVDEAGDGSVIGMMANNFVRDNSDEGLDFDEEGNGGFLIDLVGIVATGNGDEGIKVSSANDGNVNVDLRNVNVQNNGDDGIQIEAEDGDGQAHVRFFNSRAKNNKKNGLKVTQENTVDLGTLRARGLVDVDEQDLENVEEI
ncbi:MAG: hypothetical protein ACWA5Q_06905 [bacterium]